jgi:hypothetical protein
VVLRQGKNPDLRRWDTGTPRYTSYGAALLRHKLLYARGRFTLTFHWGFGTLLRGQTRHKTGEFHQVRNSEQRPPLSHKDFRIRHRNVSPLRRNGATGSVVHTQQESLAGPVMAFADADELLASERMEGVSYADKVR